MQITWNRTLPLGRSMRARAAVEITIRGNDGSMSVQRRYFSYGMKPRDIEALIRRERPNARWALLDFIEMVTPKSLGAKAKPKSQARRAA